MSDIHLSDIGTLFQLTLLNNGAALDVSTASKKQIWFQKPNGVVLTKSATFATDGTNGVLQYTAVADDLDVAGDWQMQAYVEFGTPATSGWHSEIVRFTVSPNLA